MYPSKHVILTLPLTIALLSGCATIQDALNIRRPTATLNGLTFQDISLDSAQLLFDLEIENPYPVALPLLNLDYNLATQAKSFLTGKADLQTTIAPNSKASVSLPAKVTYLDLLQAFKNLRPGSVIPYTADLGLSVDTPALGTLRLPINKQGNLSVPTIPDIADVNWKQIILNKTRQQ